MNSKAQKIDHLILIDGSGSMSGPLQVYLQQAVTAAVAKSKAAGKTVKVFVLSDRSAHETTDFNHLNLMCGGFTGYSLGSLPPETRSAQRIALITDGQVPPDSVDQIGRFSAKTQVIALKPEKAWQDFEAMCAVRGLACRLTPAQDLERMLVAALGKGLPKPVIDTRNPDVIKAENTLQTALEQTQRQVSRMAAQLQNNFSEQNRLKAERKTLTKDFAKAIAERDRLETALAALKPAAKSPARNA